MHGIYVDARHCMRLVPREPDESTTWSVQGVDPHGSDAYDPDGWNALLTVTGEEVALVRGDVVQRGVRVDENTIEWTDGDVWSRLQLSYAQAYALTRRPYMPLTLILLFKGSEALAWSWDRVARLVRQSA
jgi:hypothetical protein